MDWKTFASTLLAVFLAELGDKTQLATLTLAAGSRAPWAVFLGAALALVAASAIAVAAGEVVARLVSPALLERAAGVAFILIGLAYLLARH